MRITYGPDKTNPIDRATATSSFDRGNSTFGTPLPSRRAGKRQQTPAVFQIPPQFAAIATPSSPLFPVPCSPSPLRPFASPANALCDFGCCRQVFAVFCGGYFFYSPTSQRPLPPLCASVPSCLCAYRVSSAPIPPLRRIPPNRRPSAQSAVSTIRQQPPCPLIRLPSVLTPRSAFEQSIHPARSG